MENLPLVSVLMAAYNREAIIASGIESFLKQTYPNAELLVCDDCSTDNTVAVVEHYAKKHPNIVLYKNERNKKFIHTINWLFAQAKGDYICICDSDDWMADNRIAHQLHILQQYGADAVISEFNHVHSDGKISPHGARSTAPFVIKENSKDVFFPSGSLFMKRSVIEKVKGYPEYFADAFCADIYFINTIAANFKLMYDPTHIYYYRLTPGSMTQAFDLYKLSKLELAHFLIKQRVETGTDFLEQQNFEALEKERVKIFNDKKWQSEQYRLYAARAIDENDFKQAARLIKKAYGSNLFSLQNYQTLLYYIRKKVAMP